MRGEPRRGHLPDSPATRELIVRLVVDKRNLIGKDIHGVELYIRNEANGTQTWARVQNGIIKSGGQNEVQYSFELENGLFRMRPVYEGLRP